MAFSFTWTGTALDEDVFAFTLSQSEGEFAILEIEIRNPRVSLLRPGAPLWGELRRDGVLLTRGRLVGLPESLGPNLVSLSFIARPDNFEDLKAALAASLKVLPYYDPIWYAAERREDPDVALEARPSLWHIDPTTHAVSVSDILVGEDGLVSFSADDVLADSVQISFAQAPVTRVSCQATVQWSESGAGVVDLSARIGRIASYTGQGLAEDWPRAGASIGGGWFVSQASAKRLDGGAVPSQQLTLTTAEGRGYALPRWVLQPTFKAGYAVERPRSETVSFTLAADVQPLTAEASEDALLTLSLSSAELDQPIDAGGALPIGDLRRKQFFATDRGLLSLQHLVLLCRARLLARARAVSVSWQTSFEQAAALSLRHSAQLVDERLPGGQATGKVVGLRLSMSGDSGEARGEVTIACTVGRGSTLVPVDEPDTYADAYAAEYSDSPGSSVVVGSAGDVAFSLGAFTLDDDGLNLMDMRPARVVRQLTIRNAGAAQEAALTERTFEDLAELLAVLGDKYTEVALELAPLPGGPFATAIPVTVSPLSVPRTINLEA